MKVRNFIWFISIITTVVGIGCSKSSTDSASTDLTNNPIGSAISTLKSKIDGASGILDSKSLTANQFLDDDFRTMSSFSTAWTTTSPGVDNPKTNANDPISFKEYMGIQLTSDVLGEGGQGINAFGRMKSAFAIFCAVGVGATASGYTIDSQGYLAAGTYTITFTAAVKAAMQTGCGISPDNIADGTAMTMTVENGSTNYDRVLGFNLFNQKYMVKNDATVLRVATAENTSNGYSRTIAEYNKSTSVTRAQAVYVGAPSSGASVEVFRLFYDETNDSGMILGYRGSSTGVNNAVRYLLSGKPSSGDALSLSLRADQELSSSSSYEACVLSASGAITTDGSRCTASSTRLAGADISGSASIISTFFTAYSGTSDSDDWGKDGLTDATTLNFTNMTDLPTAAITP